MSDQRFKKQQNLTQDKVQEVTPSMIKEIKLQRTYKCFKFFSLEGIIFEYPSILKISLEANEIPIRKGKIKPKIRYSTEGPGGRYTEAHGTGPFKEEIEIPPLKPHESKNIEIRTDIIKYIPRLTNPASLQLMVLDSEDQHRGYEIVYFDLKNVEEVKKEVRNKVIFGTVILTFLMTLFFFCKEIISLFR